MKAFAAALALTTAPAGEPAAEPYRARGSDPAWSLTVAEGRLTYTIGRGRPVTIAAPARSEEEGIFYHRAPGLELSIVPAACSDEASGLRYAHSVLLRVGRKSFGGCGGALLPADSLDGTSWHFAEIAGESTGLTGDIFEDDRYAIDFGADRFAGYSGCNRIGGRYRIADGVMTVEEFGSTRRGCGEPEGRRERAAWRIMSGPMRVSRPSPDQLQLAGEGGTIRLRRIPE